MSTDFYAVYSPRFEVTVGGTRYLEADGLIQDLVIEQTVDGAALCSFTLNYEFDPASEEFAGFNWGDVELGTDLKASVGWGGAGSIEPVFVGSITSLNIEFRPETGPTLAVSGYGPLHQMMRGVVERSWSDTTVPDVAKDVLNSYFSKIRVKGGGSKRNRIIQHNQNDFRFIQHLAREYGFEFFADRETAYFTPRTSLGAATPELTLNFGNTLNIFEGEISNARQVKTVEVRYWDMQTEQRIIGSASQDTGEGKEVFRIPCDSKEEADDIAQSKLSTLSMQRATGSGETDGIPELKAGSVIRLEGLGERFTTNYYVTRVAHRVGSSGYRTSFDVTELPQ